MGLFSLTQEIAVDLGTANTIIINNDKIVVDQPSYVAVDTHGRLVAVGEDAKLMQGKENANIKVIRPLRDGVIADFNAAELMIRGFIKMVSSKNRWFSPSLRIVVCIPSGSTEVEIRAVRDSSEHAGGRDVYMIYEPMAAALGIGLDVEAPQGNMIVDIGGGTTAIAVISLGPYRTRESARRLHRSRSQRYDCTPDGSCRFLPRDFARHRKVDFENRSCRAQRPRKYTARTLRRHHQKRHLPLGWRRIASRSRQTLIRQNRHKLHHCRRPVARSG